MRALSAFCLLAILALLFTGCSATASSRRTQQASILTSETAANPLELWLKEAPKPEVIACSVDASTAPEAVARFDALSAKISELYRRVYNDAQKVSSQPTAVVTLSTNEYHLADTGTGTDWKTSAQTAVTAYYQDILREIETQQKALTDYTETLRADNTISNMTSKLRQTELLVQVGSDSVKLGCQLQAIEEGARLILRSSLLATSANE